MEAINLRIDQLKGKRIGVICTDRNDLNYMISLLGYEPNKFQGCTFPMAISAKEEFQVALSHNTYIFVSTRAVEEANKVKPNQKTVEVSMDEIATKFGINVNQLKIKK